jgi:hypothetical protein
MLQRTNARTKNLSKNQDVTTNDVTTNESYYEQLLSIKPGYYNEHGFYNEHGGILSADLARVCA